MSKEVINAFHPLYVQTYMPELLKTVRIEEAQKMNGLKAGTFTRTNRQEYGTFKEHATSEPPKAKQISLEPTTFHVYSRAGVK